MSRRCTVPAVCLAGLVLAACSGSGGEVDVAPSGTLPLPLIAHGNAPFWWLRLDEGAVAFGTLGDEAMFAADGVAGPQPDAHGGFTFGAEQGARTLVATLVPGVVTDTTTGMPHPFAVTVRIDDRELQGVGGDPGALLRGFPWVVLQVGERQLPAELRPTLEFRGDGALVVADDVGCTTGRWQIDVATLRLSGVEPLASPLREALADADTFSISAGGELVLAGDDGVTLRAMRPRT